jgi:hypothetical protein
MMTLPEKELTNKDVDYMTGQSGRSEQSDSVDRASGTVDLSPITSVLCASILLPTRHWIAPRFDDRRVTFIINNRSYEYRFLERGTMLSRCVTCQ